MDGPSTSKAKDKEASSSGHHERISFSRFLFSRSNNGSDSPKVAKKQKDTRESKEPKEAKEERPPATETQRKESRRESRSADSPRNRLANFASRSIRKSQWRLFKHKTFFGSAGGSTSRPLKPPLLTVRVPSADDSELPLELEARQPRPSTSDVVRRQRRNTHSDSGSARVGFLGDSGDSSGFVDEASTSMALPATPLSASSSVSEGWKYSSQKILWKLRPRYMHSQHSSTSASSSTDSAWRSQDSATWRSVDGTEVVLRGARIESLSPVERIALRAVAYAMLTKMMPGINIQRLSKRLEDSTWKAKRQKLIKAKNLIVTDSERRPSAISTDDEPRSVFGVSLSATLEWERCHESNRCQSLDDSAVSLYVPQSAVIRPKFSAQRPKPVRSEPEMVSAVEDERQQWLFPQPANLHQRSLPLVGYSSPPLSVLAANKATASISTQVLSHSLDTPQVKPRSRIFSTSLERASCSRETKDQQISTDTEPHQLKIPRIIEACTAFLIRHGLSTVGLFRVAGSAKRCRQLRVSLESSSPSIPHDRQRQLTPHDVATVLKEYLRDLPNSLLPTEHYQAYVAAAKLTGDERLTACRLLVALLPLPNVDTLLVLLRCLYLVAQHATDYVDENGSLEQGNRMDEKNLATVFAPCILRYSKNEKLVTCLQENELQIGIIETMIRHVEEIFSIPRDLQAIMFGRLRETEPDRLDRLLTTMAKQHFDFDTLPSPFPPMLEEEIVRSERRKSSTSGVKRSDSWPTSLNEEPQHVQVTSQQPSTSSSAPEEGQKNAHGRRSTRRDTQALIIGSISAVALRASAARRRLRNVFRAFRISSRSTPNVSTTQCETNL